MCLIHLANCSKSQQYDMPSSNTASKYRQKINHLQKGQQFYLTMNPGSTGWIMDHFKLVLFTTPTTPPLPPKIAVSLGPPGSCLALNTAKLFGGFVPATHCAIMKSRTGVRRPQRPRLQGIERDIMETLADYRGVMIFEQWQKQGATLWRSNKWNS